MKPTVATLVKIKAEAEKAERLGELEKVAEITYSKIPTLEIDPYVRCNSKNKYSDDDHGENPNYCSNPDDDNKYVINSNYGMTVISINLNDNSTNYLGIKDLHGDNSLQEFFSEIKSTTIKRNHAEVLKEFNNMFKKSIHDYEFYRNVLCNFFYDKILRYLKTNAS